MLKRLNSNFSTAHTIILADSEGVSIQGDCDVIRLIMRSSFYLLRSNACFSPTALPYQESGVQAGRLSGFLLRSGQHRQLPGLVSPHGRGGDLPV